MTSQNIFKKAIDNLDKTLTILSFFLALILILMSFIRNFMYGVLGIILLSGCAIYLFCVHKSKDLSGILKWELRANSSFLQLLNISFFLILCCSIISLYLRSDPYVRPLSYFISIILLVSILAVEILFLPRSKLYAGFVLLKIILIPLSIVWSQLLIFPEVIGADPWWHRWFTQNILDTGFIPEGFNYSKLPIFHLISGITSLVTGLDYKMATMFSISLLQIICFMLFMFLLGKFLFNTKVGLLAALLLGVSSDVIHMSYWTIPNSLGIVLIPIIVYLLFKIKKTIGSSLSILLMIVLILTHTGCSASMAIALFAFWAGFEFYERGYSAKRNRAITLCIAVFFITAMLAWWMYASGTITSLARVINWAFNIDYFAHKTPVYEGITQYSYDIPILELIFNDIGNNLFWVFALFGCFYMISEKVKNPYRFGFVVGGLTTLGIHFFAIVGYCQMLAFRGAYFTTVMLSIPLAIMIFLVCMKLKKNYMKTLFVVTIVAVLSFSMIMTPTANMDNPLFKNMAVRSGTYTESELQAFETISKLTDENIGTDGRVVGHLVRLPHLSGRLFSMQECFYTKDFFYERQFLRPITGYTAVTYQNLTYMIRKEISHRTISVSTHSFVKLDYEPEQVLAEEGFSRIYDSGSVSAFCWNWR